MLFGESSHSLPIPQYFEAQGSMERELSARYDSSGIEDRSMNGGIVIERLSLLDDDAS